MLPPASRVARQKVVELMWWSGSCTKKRSSCVIRSHSTIPWAFTIRFSSVRRAPLGLAVVPEVKRMSASPLAEAAACALYSRSSRVSRFPSSGTTVTPAHHADQQVIKKSALLSPSSKSGSVRSLSVAIFSSIFFSSPAREISRTVRPCLSQSRSINRLGSSAVSLAICLCKFVMPPEALRDASTPRACSRCSWRRTRAKYLLHRRRV